MPFLYAFSKAKGTENQVSDFLSLIPNTQNLRPEVAWKQILAFYETIKIKTKCLPDTH